MHFRRYLCVITAQTMQKQDGMTALVHAAAKSHTDCVRVLVEGGASLDVSSHMRMVGPDFEWDDDAFVRRRPDNMN